MSDGDPIDVVRRLVAADNGRDGPGYRALLWDDYRAEVNGAEAATSGDAEAAALAHYWQGFPDGRVVEEQVFADGNAVTFLYRLVGTNDGDLEGSPATGRRVDVAGCTILVVEEGRVRRTFRYVDVMGMRSQLGQLPGAADAS